MVDFSDFNARIVSRAFFIVAWKFIDSVLVMENVTISGLFPRNLLFGSREQLRSKFLRCPTGELVGS
jgi:hypothetical protein